MSLTINSRTVPQAYGSLIYNTNTVTDLTVNYTKCWVGVRTDYNNALSVNGVSANGSSGTVTARSSATIGSLSTQGFAITPYIKYTFGTAGISNAVIGANVNIKNALTGTAKDYDYLSVSSPALGKSYSVNISTYTTLTVDGTTYKIYLPLEVVVINQLSGSWTVNSGTFRTISSSANNKFVTL